MDSMPSVRSIHADAESSAALKDLQRIPGIGPSLARDLLDLGVRSVEALKGKNPEKLYDQLSALRGAHQDRCVLYTFRCAVYFASEDTHDAEKLKWWNWQDGSTSTSRKRTSARR
jgi:hypothetical protein